MHGLHAAVIGIVPLIMKPQNAGMGPQNTNQPDNQFDSNQRQDSIVSRFSKISNDNSTHSLFDFFKAYMPNKYFIVRDQQVMFGAKFHTQLQLK